MTDIYDSIAREVAGSARRQITGNTEVNPDQAAKNLKTAEDLGLPPEAVETDPKYFEQRARARKNVELYQTEPIIQEWLSSFPEGVKVSGDDFEGIGMVARKLGPLAHLFSTPIRLSLSESAIEGMKRGFGEEPLGVKPENRLKYPVFQMFQPVIAPLDFVLRAPMGAMGFVAGYSKELARELGLNETRQRQLEREIFQLAQAGLIESGMRVHDTYQGKPPVGAHPITDAIKREQAVADAKAFETLGEAIDATKTRERAPAGVEALLETRLKGKYVGLDPVEVNKNLEKITDPVLQEEITRQLPGALATGADVEVPFSMWVARSDPELRKALVPFSRLREEGLTVEEAKVIQEAPEKVTGAAVKVEGKVYEGIHHGEAVLKAEKELGKGIDSSIESDLTGFVTSKGRYVTREEALQIASDASQLERPRAAKEAGKLLSEDMRGELINQQKNIEKRAMSLDPLFVREEPKAALKAEPKAFEEFEKGAPKFEQKSIGLEDSRVKEVNEALPSLLKDLETRFPTVQEKVNDLLRQLKAANENVDVNSLIDGIHKSLDLIETNVGVSEVTTKLRKVLDKIEDVMDEPLLQLAEHRAQVRAHYKYYTETFENLVDPKAKWLEHTSIEEMLKSLERPYEPRGNVSEMFQHAEKSAFEDAAKVLRERAGGGKELSKGAKPDELTWGMTKSEHARYLKKIEELRNEQEESAFKAAHRAAERKLTQEWKDNEKEVRGEVEIDFRYSRFLADDFFRTDKLPNASQSTPAKLSAAAVDDLYGKGTSEQLPSYAITKKGGKNPDEVATMLAYDSGQQMIQDLATLERERRASGLTIGKFREAQVDLETARRMEERYGDLTENIRAARQTILESTAQADILHDEMVALARQTGKEPPFTRKALEEGAAQAFEEMPLAQASKFPNFQRNVGKQGREAEKSLLAGNLEDAYVAKQRQFLSFLQAREASELQKDLQETKRLADRYANNKTLANVDQEFTDHVHQLLEQIGYSTKRNPTELAEALAGRTLQDFAKSWEGRLAEVPVADFLTPDFRKPIDELTVREFRAIRDTIKTLDHNGKALKQVEVAGRKEAFEDVKKRMIEQLETFPAQTYSIGKRALWEIPRDFIRGISASNLIFRTILFRLDRADPNNIFTQTIVRRVREMENRELDLLNQTSKAFADLANKKTIMEKMNSEHVNSLINNTLIRNPLTGELETLQRKHLLKIMLNMGNESNLKKLIEGHGIGKDLATSEAFYGASEREIFEGKKKILDDFVMPLARKEDWDYVQGVWDIYADINTLGKEMQRRVSGVPADEIPAVPVNTPHGQYRGGFIRLDRGRIGADIELKKNALEEDGYIRAMPPKGYSMARTGDIYPIDLDIDTLPWQLRGIIHDIAFREGILDIAKFAYDKDINNAFTKHFGKEYAELFIPWLRDIANPNPLDMDVAKGLAYASLWLRQNVASVLIGLNPVTVAKHGSTAGFLSANEVGAANFLRELKNVTVQSPASRADWKFAMENSNELKYRRQYWAQKVEGGHATGIGQAKDFSEFVSALYHGVNERSLEEFSRAGGIARTKSIELGTIPVAASDLMSAVPSWLAKYKQAIEAGETHADAVFLADHVVVRAHGSLRTSEKPSMVRYLNKNPFTAWMTPFTNFFNHVWNKQVEGWWQAGDAIRTVKEGEVKAGLREGFQAGQKILYTLILPAIIEEIFTPMTNDQHKSWGHMLAEGIAKQTTSAFVLTRDLGHLLITGSGDPAMGLIGSFSRPIWNTIKDIGGSAGLTAKRRAEVAFSKAITAFAMASGVGYAQLERTGKFLKNWQSGRDRPRSGYELIRGLARGQTRPGRQ